MSTEPATNTQRFTFRIDPWMRPLMLLMGGTRGNSFVEVDDSELVVHFGLFGFRARIDRSSITAAERSPDVFGGWGVHGFWGSWLVNGSSRGIVQLILEPKCRAWLLGFFPLHVRRLAMSLREPEAFLTALHSS